jgi:large subunit ribosomal protein L25
MLARFLSQKVVQAASTAAAAPCLHRAFSVAACMRKKSSGPIVFEATLRDDFSKYARVNANNNGKILGLLQDSAGRRTYLNLEDKPIRKVHNTLAFYNTVFPLRIDGKDPISCIVKAIHWNPIREIELRNVILYAYEPGKNTKVDIPVQLINEDKCPGLKKGGVINLVMQRVTCICNGPAIPHCIDLDLGSVEIGHRCVSTCHAFMVFRIFSHPVLLRRCMRIRSQSHLFFHEFTFFNRSDFHRPFLTL